MEETWLDIEGYENEYRISNFGNVLSLKSNKILKPMISGQYKYLTVVLSKKGKVKRFYIHRLVAKHFLPNPENKYTVNHINGNKFDNNILNLEWATPSEQNNHAYINKLKLAGENCNLSKLKEFEVLEIFKDKTSKLKDIAKRYNISEGTVSQIRRKIIWKQLLKDL
jgi:hypothetical protein